MFRLDVNLTLRRTDELHRFHVFVNQFESVEVTGEASTSQYAWLNLRSAIYDAASFEKMSRRNGFTVSVFDADEHEPKEGCDDCQAAE